MIRFTIVILIRNNESDSEKKEKKTKKSEKAKASSHWRKSGLQKCQPLAAIFQTINVHTADLNLSIGEWEVNKAIPKVVYATEVYADTLLFLNSSFNFPFRIDKEERRRRKEEGFDLCLWLLPVI